MFLKHSLFFIWNSLLNLTPFYKPLKSLQNYISETKNMQFAQNIKSQHYFHMDTDSIYGEFGFPVWVGLASFLNKINL